MKCRLQIAPSTDAAARWSDAFANPSGPARCSVPSSAMTRSGIRAGAKALETGRAFERRRRAGPAAKRRGGTARRPARTASPGMAFGAAGARRYYLYKPPGLDLVGAAAAAGDAARLRPGCQRFAISTRMNRMAARERFLVLYPEQDRLANPQRCWNWYGTRSRRLTAKRRSCGPPSTRSACSIRSTRSVSRIAGLSAGASMAALLATRYPDRFKAVVMHSGVPPGAADSAALRDRRDARRGREPAALAGRRDAAGRRCW